MSLLQGLSRYDAISKITKSMHYDNLGKCGHLVFTAQPLPQATQVSNMHAVCKLSCDQVPPDSPACQAAQGHAGQEGFGSLAITFVLPIGSPAQQYCLCLCYRALTQQVST